jgi:hypothetical protein
MRLVFYTLAAATHDIRHEQLVISVQSLRRYNRRIPVCIFLFNNWPKQSEADLRAHGAQIYTLGTYGDYLERISPRTAAALSGYPMLGKWLVLADIPDTELSQVLYLDCDTVFFDDVEKLFDRYQESDWYAREEPNTRSSPYGYDPSYLDQATLSQHFRHEGVPEIPCYNTGVSLFNHGVWRSIAALRHLILAYSWRFLTGLYLSEPHRLSVATRAFLTNTLIYADRLLALRYPTRNFHILDQLALWLTLGHIPRLRHSLLSGRDVLMSTEFLNHEPKDGIAVLCHYFSINMNRFFVWNRYLLSVREHDLVLSVLRKALEGNQCANRSDGAVNTAVEMAVGQAIMKRTRTTGWSTQCT